MCTLPGLPMIGHGQIEGYGEKYGMEYRRPKLNETPDGGLVAHHERMLFPILHKRYLFAEVEHFRFYDFATTEGGIDENVFAYSNQQRGERAIVIYHNRHAQARGFVRESVASLVKGAGLQRTSLAGALGLSDEANAFLIMRDHVSGLEFIRRSQEIHQRGLYIDLGAYQSHVFLDLREVRDHDDERYAELHHALAGQGVVNVEQALIERRLGPLHAALRGLINGERLLALHGLARKAPRRASAKAAPSSGPLPESQGSAPMGNTVPVERTSERASKLVFAELQGATAQALAAVITQQGGVQATPAAVPTHPLPAGHGPGVKAAPRRPTPATLAAPALANALGDDPATWAPVLAWHMLRPLAAQISAPDWFDAWLLALPLRAAFIEAGLTPGAADYAVQTVRQLLAHAAAGFGDMPAPVRTRAATGAAVLAQAPLPAHWQADAALLRHLQANTIGLITYVNKEAFEQFVHQIRACGLLLGSATAAQLRTRAQALLKAVEKAGYRV